MCGQSFRSLPKKAISAAGGGSGQIEKTEDPRLYPDSVLNVIRFRRSIRSFQETEIPKEIIQQILAAGRFTHTAKNMRST